MPIEPFTGSFTIEPPAASHTISASGTHLTMRAVPETDWWRIPPSKPYPTGVESHSGALFARQVDATRDFTAGVWLRGGWGVQYDQGCLMVITSASGVQGNWVKAGVEMEEGEEFISCVVTSPWSDWSIEPAKISTSTASSGPANAGAIYIQITREGPLLTVKKFLSKAGPWDTPPAEARQISGGSWVQLIWTTLGKPRAKQGDLWCVGCMVCGPTNKDGTTAEFFNFSFEYK
ncbi:hypothetical protein MKEN_00847100 [Mycena kentingensis (nom. inval.)]|nr:hypothetical protein MKEN_00847100 [Mycena kentingensis (nom. inval.)]